MGGDDDLTFRQKSAIRWAGFKKFMYNKEAGTVMGRNGKAWAQLLVFYTIFYLCLAAFWAAMLAVFLQTIDPNRPTWNSYVSTPGLAYVPSFRGERIEFTLPFDSDSKAGKAIIKPLNNTWYLLDPENQGDLEPCPATPGEPDEGRFCSFDREKLGPCKPPYWGYDEGKPCLYVNLNKVWGWVPENYDEDEDVPEGAVENQIVVQCEAEYEKYADYFDANATIFYPEDGISFGHYPYVVGTSKEDQARFINPIVAIQFSVTLNQKVRIRCFPLAGNVEPLRGIYESDHPTEFSVEFFIDDQRENM